MKLKSLGLLIPLVGASLVLTSCGVSSGTASGSKSSSSDSVAACADGTVASYLNTSCSQQSTVYIWQSYSCVSSPTSICDGLGTNGASINMKMDPNGPYTILVGDTSLWNVAAGQSVQVMIGGLVYGASANQNWPHFNQLAGQSGDGTEENKTTVACGNGCSDDMQGVSDVLCDASVSLLAPCTDQDSISAYPPTRFVAATASNPYKLTIEVTLNGGTHGTATLHSVGTHIGNL